MEKKAFKMKSIISPNGNLKLDFSPYTLLVSNKMQENIDLKKRILIERNYE